MWFRRSLSFLALLVAVPAIVIVAPLGVWAATVMITENRNPDAFFAYLDDYTDLELTAANKSEWLSLGDESCAWLADQPHPWFSRADRFQHSGLSARYWREHPPPSEWDGLDFHHDPQESIVPAAWSRLCPDTWDLHEPHNPFNRAPSD